MPKQEEEPEVIRDAKGRFTKNNKGRPKGSKDKQRKLLENFSAYLRNRISEKEINGIIAALIKTAGTPDTRTQVGAATILFHYAYGKPPDTIQLDGQIDPFEIGVHIWHGMSAVKPGAEEE